MLKELVSRRPARGRGASDHDHQRQRRFLGAVSQVRARDVARRWALRPHYRRDAHFNGAHATEYMVTIRMADSLRKAA
jgi:hypothetical protein